VIAALVSFGTMAARSGSSIEAELRAASINSRKASAWRLTKSRLPRARARRTSARNRDRTPLSSSNPLQIVLFDIDGTLILTGGAGGRAMSRAFEDTFGIPGALHGIPMGGRTDAGILAQAAALIRRASFRVSGRCWTRWHRAPMFFWRSSPATPRKVPGSSSNISISGDFFGAARLATRKRSGTICLRWRWGARVHAVRRKWRPPTWS